MTAERFVTLFGRTLAGNTPASPRSLNTPLVPRFGQYGFRQEFLEGVERFGPHGNNQGRHVVGYMVVGYAWSGWASRFANWYREPSGSADYHLGVVGINLGLGVQEGTIPLREIGPWIRSNVGYSE
jgi:hypothetical protein